MVSGILTYLYGESSGLLYRTSKLHTSIPGLDLDRKPTEKQETGITRTVRMIETTLRKRFGYEYERAIMLLSLVHAVDAGNGAKAAYIPEEVRELASRYEIGLNNPRTASS